MFSTPAVDVAVLDFLAIGGFNERTNIFTGIANKSFSRSLILTTATFAPFTVSDRTDNIRFEGEQAGLQYTYNHALKSAYPYSNELATLRGSAAVYHRFSCDDIKVSGFRDLCAGKPADSAAFNGDVGTYINDTRRWKQGVEAFQQYAPMEAQTYGETGDPRTANKPKFYRRMDYGTLATIIAVDPTSFRDKAVKAPANPFDPNQIALFLQAAFDPTRTALGAAQLADLKADLLDAQTKGVTWKFIYGALLMQNLGASGGNFRYEGYAAERNEILAFIKDNNIKNVVFVNTDVDGVWVNNLTYQTAPGQAQIQSGAFEVAVGQLTGSALTTASLQREANAGNVLLEQGLAAGLITPQLAAAYDALPVLPDTDSDVNDKDDFAKSVFNDPAKGLLTQLGYDTLGLANSGITATLFEGDYFSGSFNTFGVFNIDANKILTVEIIGRKDVPAKTALLGPASLEFSAVSLFNVIPQP